MKVIRTAILSLLLSMTAICAADAPFVITANGKAVAAVFVAKDASPSEKLAAEELKTYIKKLSGATIPDASSPTEKSIVMATSQSAHLPEALKDKLTGTRHDESFIIAVENGRLYLAGKTPVGTLYAAYTLLEEEFNVSWLFPGDKFEYVEKRPSLSVKPVVKVDEPVFIYRLINPTPFSKTKDFFIWAARNRIQAPGPYGLEFTYTPKNKDFFEPRLRDGVVSTGGHTTFYRAAPPAKYRKTNPEYFALVKGKRSEKTTHADTHHCISNPELQKLVVDYIVGVYKKYGKKVNFTFGAPDSALNWCECDNCRALDGESPDHSRRFHLVAQKIARMVYERCPEMQLKLWAYWTYRNIPRGLTVDPRMQIYFCSHGRSYAHYLDDPNCAANVRIYKLMKEWLKLNQNVYLYEYTSSNKSGYAPIYQELAHDLRLYKKLGLLGLKNEYRLPDGKYPENHNPWENSLLARSNWAYYYLYGKLAWNPDLDMNKILEDAYLKYYGKAAFPIMKKYHAERRRVWESTEGNFGWPEGDQRTPKLLQNPGVYKKLSSLLSQAEKAAGKNTVALERIRFDRRCLEKVWLAKNREYKKIASQAFFAPLLNGNVKIDGNLSEGIWNRACYVSDFFHWRTHKPLPAELETTAAVFCDDKALYIGVTAREPAMDKLTANGKKDDSSIFNDDGIEILLAPPNEANRRYQFRINTKGQVADCVQPGSDTSWNSGIQATCRRYDDHYVIEARIPFEKMEGRFKLTDRCSILIGRGRRINDGLGSGAYSLGGAAFQNTTNYRMMILGKAYIQNGTFLETDPQKPGVPKSWMLKKCDVVKNGNQISIKINRDGVLSQHLYDPRGPLGQAPHPRNITVVFTASGKGRAVFFASHYSDTSENGKNKRKFCGSKKIYQQTVSEKVQDFQFDYTIPADQWMTIAINTPDEFVQIDRVSILLK